MGATMTHIRTVHAIDRLLQSIQEIAPKMLPHATEWMIGNIAPLTPLMNLWRKRKELAL